MVLPESAVAPGIQVPLPIAPGIQLLQTVGHGLLLALHSPLAHEVSQPRKAVRSQAWAVVVRAWVEWVVPPRFAAAEWAVADFVAVEWVVVASMAVAAADTVAVADTGNLLLANPVSRSPFRRRGE